MDELKMEVYEWEGLNLSFFLKDNSNDFLAGFHAFKGESNLIDNMLVTGNFTTGYGGGIDPLSSMNILDKPSFIKPLDFDKWLDSTQKIAFTAAINPLASLALRKNIFKKLNLTNLNEHDLFINNTPSDCQGTTIITTIVLSIVWAAVARNYKRNQNSYIDDSHLFSVFVNGAMSGKFLDFEEAQKAIKKSLDVIRHVSFEKLSLDEVKSIYEKFEEVVSEFNFLDAVIEIDNDT